MSTADWKVGDKILCVDSKPTNSETGLATMLEVGKEYTLHNIHRCRGFVVSVGLPAPFPFRCCGCAYCPAEFETSHYFAWRFIKLDPDFKLEIEEAYTPMCIPETNIIIHQGNTK